MNQGYGNNRGKVFNRGFRNIPYARDYANNYNNNSPNYFRQPENSNGSHCSRQNVSLEKSNKKIENVESIRRLKEISLPLYMQRRGLNAIMSGNPRFHLVGFNGVPKCIKTSIFLADMALNVPEVKSRTIISIHTTLNNCEPPTVNYLVGFNSVKIIKKLEEIFGTGYIELYKANVQVVIPDIQDTKECEYNHLVNDETQRSISPYKLTHKDTNLLNICEMLEEICGDKFGFVSAICCVGETTYINLNLPNLLLKLTEAAEKFAFKIAESDTIAMTGTIPSEYMGDESADTPINQAETAKLSTEEIVKFTGFKSLIEKHEKEKKNESTNLIKATLLSLERQLQSTMYQTERNIEQMVAHQELKISSGFAKLEDSMNRLEMEIEIVRQNTNSKTIKPQLRKSSNPVNSPTSETTGKGPA